MLISGLFVPLLIRQLKDWTGNGEEREGMTHSKEPQGGIDPGGLKQDTVFVHETFAPPTEVPGKHFPNYLDKE